MSQSFVSKAEIKDIQEYWAEYRARLDQTIYKAAGVIGGTTLRNEVSIATWKAESTPPTEALDILEGLRPGATDAIYKRMDKIRLEEQQRIVFQQEQKRSILENARALGALAMFRLLGH